MPLLIKASTGGYVRQRPAAGGRCIVRRLNPDCGFVLLDKLEQMDMTTLQEFSAWLEAEHLQAIATRVSTGSECQIIIEDGMVKDAEPTCRPSPKSPSRKAGRKERSK